MLVLLLKEKSQAIKAFKIFHVWINNEAQCQIGSLRSDNGGEYTSNEFRPILGNMGLNIRV